MWFVQKNVMDVIAFNNKRIEFSANKFWSLFYAPPAQQ